MCVLSCTHTKSSSHNLSLSSPSRSLSLSHRFSLFQQDAAVAVAGGVEAAVVVEDEEVAEPCISTKEPYICSQNP